MHEQDNPTWTYEQLTASVRLRIEQLAELCYTYSTPDMVETLKEQATGALIWWQTLVYRSVDESRYNTDNESLRVLMTKFLNHKC